MAPTLRTREPRKRRSPPTTTTTTTKTKTKTKNSSSSSLSSSSSSSSSIGLLSLPTEVLQEIGLATATTADILALSQTCRMLYHGALAAANSYFWYRQAPGLFGNQYSATKGPWQYGAKRQFDDYRAALARNAASPAKGRTDRCCQVCMGRVCQKFWEDFKMWICPDCFEQVAVDGVDIKWLKLPLKDMRSQRRGRVTSHRFRPTTYYWREDVDAAVAERYPGRTLHALVEERRSAAEDKETATTATRSLHTARVKASAITQYSDPSGAYAVYHRMLPVKLATDEINRDWGRFHRRLHVIISKLGPLKREKPQTWVDATARDTLLPGAWVDTCSRAEAPYWMLSAVRDYHEARFDAAGLWSHVPNASGLSIERGDTIVLGEAACGCASLAGRLMPAMELNHHYEKKHFECWFTEDFMLKEGSVTTLPWADWKAQKGPDHRWCTDEMLPHFLSQLGCECARRP